MADELQELNMSAAQLAKELGIPANRVTEILRGRRGISADTALRLSRWMGTTPQFWMNLQRNYELASCRAGAWGSDSPRGEAVARTTQPHNGASSHTKPIS